ncbi:MAG: glycine zipper 2TM domain-containing protein [Gammaproteobacteria bacterium]
MVLNLKSRGFLYVLSASCMGLLLAGCGGPKQPSPGPTAPVTEDVAVPAETDAAAAQAAKEAELAQREADMAMKEREAELAQREADLAARQKSAARPAVAPRPAGTASSANKPKPAPAPVPAPVLKTYVIPAGTQLSVQIIGPVSTKTAQVGDRIDGRVTSDITVDGKTLVTAGSAVSGSVTDVISGSQKIGGTPTLGLGFDTLVLANGNTAAISGRLVQQGKSDTARDTAKIAGGALVGAVIGNKIDKGTGKIVGGIVGGAAGAAVAQKTGTEVEIPAGTIVGFMLDNSIEVTAN